MSEKLETYRTLREALTDAHMHLAQEMPRKVLRQGRKKLGIGQLDLDTEAERDMAQVIVFDYCLYHYRQNGQTLLEKYFADRAPAPGSPEAQLQDALASYRYTLIEPLGPGDEEGTSCIDTLQGIGITVMDEGLASTAHAHMILGAGLIWPGDFAMPTGAVLPATTDAAERIGEELNDQLDAPIEEVDMETLNRYECADLAATIIKHCLRDGALQRITDHEDEPV